MLVLVKLLRSDLWIIKWGYISLPLYLINWSAHIMNGSAALLIKCVAASDLIPLVLFWKYLTGPSFSSSICSYDLVLRLSYIWSALNFRLDVSIMAIHLSWSSLTTAKSYSLFGLWICISRLGFLKYDVIVARVLTLLQIIISFLRSTQKIGKFLLLGYKHSLTPIQEVIMLLLKLRLASSSRRYILSRVIQRL